MAATPSRRRRGRPLLIALAIVVAVPAAGYVTLRSLLRDEVLRPRLVAAVEQATGRALTLSGPIGLKLSLRPTVTLEGVALANPPGASRPQMLTARRVEARLALLPLLSRHVAFERVTLIEPDLLLEMDAQGQANWRFTPARAATPTPAPTAPAEPAAAAPLALSIAAIGIEGGRIGWRDSRSGAVEVLEIGDLALTAAAPDAPIDFEGHFTLRGAALATRGQAGPLPRLLGTQAEPAEWPLRLSLAAPGAQLTLDGAMARPEAAAGWRVTLNATADRADRLAPFLPRLALPPLQGLDLSASLADAGRGQPPEVQSLRLHLASGDLTGRFPGLRLGATTLSVPGSGAAATLNAALTLNGEAWQVEAGLPPLPLLLSAEPWPFTAALRGEGTAARVEGRLLGPRHAGLDATLTMQAAESAPLARALLLPLPAVQDLRLSARLMREGTRLSAQNIDLHMRGLILTGEAALEPGPRPSVTARLEAPRVDLDELSAAQPAAQPATVPATPAPPQPAPATPAAPAVPATPAPAPAPAAASPGLIPPLPLPLAALQRFDADLRLTVGDWVADRVTYRDQRITLVVKEGRLVAEPVSLGIPGGRVSLGIRADSTLAPPRLALTARHEGSGIDLRPLLQTYRLPAQSSGRLELEADLAGSGTDLQQVAASLDGTAALAMANGQIDNALLDRYAGELRRLLLPNAPREGSTALRCLALRIAFRDGIGRPEAMLLETGLANVAGTGEIDLKQERLNLRLLPLVRIGGVGISAPVRVTGSLANPGYRLDQGGTAQAAAGILGELASRQRESGVAALGQLAQELAGRPAGSLPDCAQQLAVARGGRGGPVPPAEARPQPEQRRVNPADLLRGLLNR